MAGALLAGAAAGAALELAFGGFLEAILTAKKKNSMFNRTLERLEGTLKSMEASVKRIDLFNRDFDRPEEINGLKELMQKGENLVKKCSSIHKYDFVRKPSYVKKLLKLDESIRRYISTVLPLQQSADGKETLFEVKQLSNQFKQLGMVSFGGGGGGFGGVEWVGRCSVPELKVNPVGLEVPLREVKRRVLDDRVSLLVLSAAGGCGKTTLVTAFCHDFQVQAKFGENIFFVIVSKSPNMLVIVNRLFQHKGYMLPNFGSEEDAIVQLELMLKQVGPNPILLVLDDVWSGSESLIEKLRFQIDNYQILVTSRSEFPRFNSTYKLPTLNYADSMSLFRQSAFPPNGNPYEPDQDIIEKIVEACKGFPLAISVMAKSLCGKPAAEWRKRSKECAKSASLLDNFELLQCLKSSVDALNEKGVECYLDLGSFPEDQKIPADILVDLWAELYGLNEDDAISNLYELSDRSLLDLVVTKKDANEDDSSYSELFVMQHDLLRELAILLSKTGAMETRKRIFMNIDGNQYPDWWINDMKPLSNATLLSINTDERFSSIWFNVEAPRVQALALNFQSMSYIMPHFIQSMENLRVLTITNCGFFPVELSNFYRLRSLSNLKRLRFERTTMPYFSFACMQSLSKLEKLSFVMCNIDQAFSESNIQFSTAFPKLLEINIDYCNDLTAVSEGFCDLPRLKTLRITNCHKLIALPGLLGNLVNLEVLRLNSCSDLAELPDSIGDLRNLRVLDLSDCLSLKKLPEQTGGLCNLRKLYMIDCLSCQLPSSVRNLVNLGEVIGDEETAGSWEVFKPYLPQLRIKVHKEMNLKWLGDDLF